VQQLLWELLLHSHPCGSKLPCSLTQTCLLCCAVDDCQVSRAGQAAMAGAIAPESSPCNPLTDECPPGSAAPSQTSAVRVEAPSPSREATIAPSLKRFFLHTYHI
jgi:hypothetical protein